MTDHLTQIENDPGAAPPGKTSFFLALLLIVIVLVVVGAFIMFQRRAEYKALADNTEVLSVPTVAVFHPAAQSGDENLVLPGTLMAYIESPIYARTNGYLKNWYRRHWQPRQ